jgi:hypothetical protein
VRADVVCRVQSRVGRRRVGIVFRLQPITRGVYHALTGGGLLLCRPARLRDSQERGMAFPISGAWNVPDAIALFAATTTGPKGLAPIVRRLCP